MTTIKTLERSLKALANRRRLAILAELQSHHSLTVSEIAYVIGLKHKSTSKHLRILTSADMLDFTKDGPFVHYRLAPAQVEPARLVLRLLRHLGQ